MIHYRLRAGLNAPLLLLRISYLIMSAAFLQLANTSRAQTPPPLTPNAQSSTPPPAPILIPDRGEVTVLKLDDQLRTGTPVSDDKALTFTISDVVDGVVDRDMYLKGRAQIRRNDTVIKADEINYAPNSDVANLIGNTELTKSNATFKGPKARLRVDAREGEMESPDYQIRDNRASGKAKKLTIEAADVFVFDKATYTTCTPENLDWYFTADRIEIDNEQKEMKGTGGVMHLFNTPVAYIPYFSLPTARERRTGLLPPIAGYNSKNGFDVTQPYYVNIAPNRDLTVLPRFMSERGVQLGGSYRTIDPRYSGIVMADYLPYDKKAGRDRWRYDWQQRQNFLGSSAGGPGAINGYVNASRVSDNLYPTDFSQTVAGAVTSQFRQEFGAVSQLPDRLSNWTVTTRALTFQTLQPNLPSTVGAPYNIMPQVTAVYRSNLVPPSSGLDGKYITLPTGPMTVLSTDFTRFSYNIASSIPNTAPGVFSQADRTVVKGILEYPQVTPGYYLRPKLSFQSNTYSATAYQPGYQPAQGFLIPTFSFDSGLAFERDAAELGTFFGQEMLLSIEPRAFYVYTPYINQANTPLFDTGDAGFGVSQIFSENTFIGNDRISDNNKLTGGITSRITEASTGAERAVFTVAQRQDFTGQQVGLTGNIANPTKYSDTLGSASIRLMGNFNADIFGQYNTQLNKFVQTTVGGSWRPTPGRSLNFGYRNVWNPPVQPSPFNPIGSAAATTTDQYNLSGQWPVTKEISLVGRWGYDALAVKTLNTLLAVEYVRDCLVFRSAYSQLLLNNNTTTQLLFQIEFRGLGVAGDNPVDLMKLNVPGYLPTPKPVPPSIYENYQ
jgi:LPS-assembly protein